MKRLWFILGVAVAAITLAVWLATGAHPGWTRTTETVMRVDAVTGLDYPETRRKFIAGVEWLGAGLGLACVLGTLGILAGRRSSHSGRRH
jgi:hypothetical protein